MPAAPPRRPRLAVWKFSSCDGCQLSLLDCERELLAVADAVEVAHFLEASSAVGRGPYDVSLVEGSITTPADAARIQRVRKASRTLVTIGACATAGGIQALRDTADMAELAGAVYPDPAWLEVLPRSTPIANHVRVDLELRGCPIDRGQLLTVIDALLHGRRPDLPTHSVCGECKARGTVCVLVASGTPCLGPITQAGCGALCPPWHRGCYGCFGPAETVNGASLSRHVLATGAPASVLLGPLRSFNVGAEAFRRTAARIEEEGGRR